MDLDGASRQPTHSKDAHYRCAADECQTLSAVRRKGAPARAPFDHPGAEAYWTILATTPAPTVRPPSRMAKRRPSSMAIGAIRVTTILTLSPGMTISTPSGSSQVLVMSVVRK